MKKRRWKKVLALTMSLAMVLTLPLGVAAAGCTCDWKCESEATAGCDVCKLDHTQCNATDVYINPTCNCTSRCTDDSNKNSSCPLCNDGARNCTYISPGPTIPDTIPEGVYELDEIGWTGGDDSDEITVGGIDATLKDGGIRFGRDGTEALIKKLEKEPVTIDLDEHGADSVTIRKPGGEEASKPKKKLTVVVGAGLRYEFSPTEFESTFDSAPGQSVTLEVKQYNEKKAENLLDQNKATLTDSEIQELLEVDLKKVSFPYGTINNLRNMYEDLTLADLKNILNYAKNSTFYDDKYFIAKIEDMVKKREAALKAGDQISEDAEILGATELGATSAGKLIGLDGISVSFKPKGYLNREDIATMAFKALEEKKLVYSTTGGVGHKDAEGNFVKEAQIGIYQQNTDGSLTSIPPVMGLELGKATISHQAQANTTYIYTITPEE